MNVDLFPRLRAVIATADDVEHGSGASDGDIAELLRVFGPIPGDFEAYLRQHGWLTVGSHEFLGLGDDVPFHLDLIETTSQHRDGMLGWRLPREYLCVYESGSSWLYCLRESGPGKPSKVVCVSFDPDEDQVVEEETGFETWSHFVLDILRR